MYALECSRWAVRLLEFQDMLPQLRKERSLQSLALGSLGEMDACPELAQLLAQHLPPSVVPSTLMPALKRILKRLERVDAELFASYEVQVAKREAELQKEELASDRKQQQQRRPSLAMLVLHEEQHDPAYQAFVRHMAAALPGHTGWTSGGPAPFCDGGMRAPGACPPDLIITFW